MWITRSGTGVTELADAGEAMPVEMMPKSLYHHAGRLDPA